MSHRRCPQKLTTCKTVVPIGANVFLFAQRYEVAQALTTAAMGLSTVLALFTLSAVMLLMTYLN